MDLCHCRGSTAYSWIRFFLERYNLVVELSYQRLVDGFTTLKARCDLATQYSDLQPRPSFSFIFWVLFHSFTRLFFSSQALFFSHFCAIQCGALTFSRPRRLAPERLKVALAKFNLMLELGIIRPSKSGWLTSLCPECNTVRDKYHMPYIQNFTSRLYGCSIFSRVDLVSDCHQIPATPEDILETAVITSFVCSNFFECLTQHIRYRGSWILCSLDFPSGGLISMIFSALVPLLSFMNNIFVLFSPNCKNLVSG